MPPAVVILFERKTKTDMRERNREMPQRFLPKDGAASPRNKRPPGISPGYIAAEETVAAAEREGVSVCDYLENLWEKRGDTQRVIEEMAACGAFAVNAPTVVEIGTGTGRYLEKVLERCNPIRYESYETARDWSVWLQSKYRIVSHDADGLTMKQTPDRSVDLVHAHGVFVYLPFVVCYSYWKEMRRITKPGSLVIFDIISETCLDESTADRWLASQHYYPCFLSTGFVVSLLDNTGFHSFEPS